MMRPEPPPDAASQVNLADSNFAGDDLVWTAYRYLTDAMTPAEVDSFETQLGRDSTTQTALTTAIELSTVVRFVAAQGDVRPHRSGPTRVGLARRRWIRATAGLAAAAGLLLTVWGPGSSIQSRAIAVARAWVNLRSEARISEPTTPLGTDPVVGESIGPVDPLAGETDVPEMTELAAEQPLPSWMLASLPMTNPDPEPAASEGN